jgi:acyl-CoA synthetase (AMP-forming)/AMP-acid ligase II
MSLGATLAAGATLYVQERFDPGEALALIERERITALHAWPHQSQAMAEHASAATRDLGSLRKIEFTSPLANLAGLEKDVWGIYGSYGLSETFTLASAFGADAPPELRHGTHGPPLPGNRMRVVDPHTGAELPAGEKGEIAVKGLTLMAGYYKVEPENAFDADGYFRTQDGGFFDADGNLHWRGRLSNLIKTGGANVSPLEIEEALRGFPGLLASVAVGVPHPTLGEVIVLCAVPTDAARPPDRESIRARLRERLASYKVPRAVFLFAPDEVAYTGTQKLQPGPLREKALARLAAEQVEIAGFAYGGRGA